MLGSVWSGLFLGTRLLKVSQCNQATQSAPIQQPSLCSLPIRPLSTPSSKPPTPQQHGQITLPPQPNPLSPGPPPHPPHPPPNPHPRRRLRPQQHPLDPKLHPGPQQQHRPTLVPLLELVDALESDPARRDRKMHAGDAGGE